MLDRNACSHQHTARTHARAHARAHTMHTFRNMGLLHFIARLTHARVTGINYQVKLVLLPVYVLHVTDLIEVDKE